MLRVLLSVLLFLAAAPAVAAESAPVRSPRVTASLISDTDAVEAGRPFRIGLRLAMAPGWHTYWQNPGDAGAPPDVTLTLPDGTKAGPIAWPAPQRMPEGPVMTYAYTGEVVLPITVTPGGGAQAIKADATWLVCEKICVPEEGSFTLDLPPGRVTPSAQAGLFAAADARLPRPSPFAARIAPDGTLTLSGAGLSNATVREATFFPAAPGSMDQDAAERATVRDGLVRIALKPGAAFSAGKPLAGVVVLRDPGGQESVLAVEAEPGPAAEAAPALAQTLLLALLGGLLLNLMPCVFPVLAMKAVALARMSGQGRREARASAAAYTGGVVLAFAALGAALLAARTTGDAAGWGFQFQSPVFVAVSAWLLFAVGLNLSGVFEVASGLEGAGQGLAARGGLAGSFFTGLLAVLVATPCTAPFMGAAIAAALAGPAAETVLVFVAMGVGLAAPYLVLGLFPGWARMLPRPGRWMDVLRGALAFPMYGAAAWLVWVLDQQAGSSGLIAALAGMVLLGFAGWAWGLGQRLAGRWRRAGQGAALAALAAAGLALAGIAAAPLGPAPVAADNAEGFTPARLAALREEGRPVFVNITASWCVTCLVNERVALSREKVQRVFVERRVAYLRGDWTRGDPAITQFLRANQRDGVPLYVLYPPGHGAPTVLPQILTEAEVLAELDKLGG